MFSCPFSTLSQSPASSANPVPIWAYSGIDLIKLVATFAMRKKCSFLIAIFSAVVFIAAFSAYTTIIVGYIGIFLGVFMPAFAMGAATVWPICRLLRNSSPSTILRLIVSIVINTVNRSSFWALAHIFKKVLKTILPSIANLYASAPIILIMRVFGVVAPTAHIKPNAINWIFGHLHGLNNRWIISNSQTNKIGGCLAI